MNIKKIFLRTLFIIISILLIMSLCGCVGQDTETTTAAAATTVPFEESTTSAETTAPKASTTNETTAKATKTHSDKESKKATTKKAKSKQTTKPSTTKRRTQKNATTVAEHCYDDNSHSMPLGNIGKWFNSRTELENYVSNIIRSWKEKRANGEISLEEFTRNCPSGYEAYSCSTCGKWTGNFKYY